MSENIDKGKQGEDYALNYLLEKGFRLLARNFRAGHSEIDLIVQKADLLVFVEVRMKATAEFGLPENSLSKAKINAIKRGAEGYLFNHPHPKDIRFDILSIIEYPEFEIVHFEDAFY